MSIHEECMLSLSVFTSGHMHVCVKLDLKSLFFQTDFCLHSFQMAGIALFIEIMVMNWVHSQIIC
jgi:hypothetical protein